MHSNKQRYFITHFYVSMYHFICHSVKMTKHGFPQRVNFSSRGVYATTRQKLYYNVFLSSETAPPVVSGPLTHRVWYFVQQKDVKKKLPSCRSTSVSLSCFFLFLKLPREPNSLYLKKDLIHSLRKEEYTVLFVEWPTTQLPLYKTGFEKLQQINSSPKI